MEANASADLLLDVSAGHRELPVGAPSGRNGGMLATTYDVHNPMWLISRQRDLCLYEIGSTSW
jgi:hypothetical protein